ncbi:hypothetical protein I7I53_08842 [Histoplasma capsulatum var. duboisii H88]|uniref:Uncharacterized protein n=1 Tax=Ajellomyces capsulatus (strain H88) TaxID=544711 RepID=A0A8A1LAG3_AJEC8|nr:hypothetical protein I7I53_08842 [Histoplasma capsulatum var. duboisii H88]
MCVTVRTIHKCQCLASEVFNLCAIEGCTRLDFATVHLERNCAECNRLSVGLGFPFSLVSTVYHAIRHNV